jgi:hypothetical protein
MDEKQIAKFLKSGGVLARVSFEIIGSPKAHVEAAINEYIANIEKDYTIHILNRELGEAEELDGGLFSTYADLEVLFEKLDKLNWLCVNFMPASIEIISPAELKFSDKDLTLWFNDLLAKLHEVSTSYRQLSTKEELFVKNMNAMVHNAVLLACEQYHTPEGIAKRIGIPIEQVVPFLESNVKNHKLEKHGEEYYLKE